MELYRHCLVPSRYPANTQFGHWFMMQRRQQCLLENYQSCSLTPEHIKKLEEIGFVWVVRDYPKIKWRNQVGSLCRY